MKLITAIHKRPEKQTVTQYLLLKFPPIEKKNEDTASVLSMADAAGATQGNANSVNSAKTELVSR